MDVAALLVAGAQALEGVPPGEAALDAALPAQTGAVGDAPGGRSAG